jgi:hypothetical protein
MPGCGDVSGLIPLFENFDSHSQVGFLSGVLIKAKNKTISHKVIHALPPQSF